MERWLAFRCRLFSACLARLIACAEFAKVLLLPVIRKTAYYADFAGNCQWGDVGTRMIFTAEGAEFFISKKYMPQPGVCLLCTGGRGFFI
jgi:hypothetical protein